MDLSATRRRGAQRHREADAGRSGKAGTAGRGHGEKRSGHVVQYDQRAARLLPHRGARSTAGWACDWSIQATWCSRAAARRRWRDHAAAADHGGLHAAGGQSRRGAGAAAQGTHADGGRIRSRAAEARSPPGKLLALDNQIDTTTGTVKAPRAVRQHATSELFPNQFVNTRLLVNTLQGVTLIPTSDDPAERQTSRSCTSIQNNAAQLQNVKTGVDRRRHDRGRGHQSGRRGGQQQLRKLQDKAQRSRSRSTRRFRGRARLSTNAP